jgi:hypothetical protein
MVVSSAASAFTQAGGCTHAVEKFRMKAAELMFATVLPGIVVTFNPSKGLAQQVASVPVGQLVRAMDALGSDQR